MKRLLDIVYTVVAFSLLWPVFLVVMLLILLCDGRPIFFSQTRIGQGGQHFQIYKFRSMRVNAPGLYFTQTQDPRITPLGRLLRRTSVDELPQLWNVLRGDMSWVGPRPDVPEQQAQYTPVHWTQRHRVHPGITGLAQVTLRSEATPQQRLALDLTYVEQVSDNTAWRACVYDLKIVLRTIARLVRGGGN